MKFLLAFLFVVLSFSVNKVRAESNQLGCTFLLCIASPTGYKAGGPICISAVKKVFRRLARGGSLPQCKSSGIPMKIRKYPISQRIFCEKGQQLGITRLTAGKNEESKTTYRKLGCFSSSFDSFGRKNMGSSLVKVNPFSHYVQFNLRDGWDKTSPEAKKIMRENGIDIPVGGNEITHPIGFKNNYNIPSCTGWSKDKKPCGLYLPILKKSSSFSSPTIGSEKGEIAQKYLKYLH